MKFTALLLYMLCIIHVNAQQKIDRFFNDESQVRAANIYTLYLDEEADFNNMNIIEDAPLGNGLLALAAISMSYLTLKRKEGMK
jgi:hypothetical protein